MPVTLVGGGEAQVSANGNTIVIPKPTGVASGDFLIAVVVTNDQTVTSSGWTSHATQQGSVSASFRIRVLYKVAGGSEPADYTFSVPSTGAPMAGVLAAYRNVDTGNPFAGHSIAASGSSSEPKTTPSVSATYNGKAFAWRAVRFNDSTNQPTTLITFSDSDTDTSYRAHARALSSSNNTQYAVGLFEYATIVNNGDSVSASISHNGSQTEETDNIVSSFVLRSTDTPPSGTTTVTGPACTTAMSGEGQVHTGTHIVTGPACTTSMSGTAATPADGTMVVAGPSPTGSIAGGIEVSGTLGGGANLWSYGVIYGAFMHGTLDLTGPSPVGSFDGGLVHGSFDSVGPSPVSTFEVLSIYGTHDAVGPSPEFNSLGAGPKIKGERVVSIEPEYHKRVLRVSPTDSEENRRT